MTQKLYVGGLNSATDDSRLHGAFAEYGEITEAVVITQGDSGASRGFGFVTFADDAAADKAIAARHSTELDGNTIVVNVARPRQSRERSGVSR